MSKKKSKKKNAGPPQALIRLSQCMIVKNEEKNIEKALSWAKGIVFEQIVVDTGSTDRTVEIAKSMGAKVYHFKWIDDFSAARNYAIKQATGNWIVFLDADEFFPVTDARKLIASLKLIQSDPVARDKYHALGCKMINIDVNGKATNTYNLTRVFQNNRSIYYHGRIHEELSVGSENTIWDTDITFFHEGDPIERKDAGNSERNIKMLRAELSLKPGDLNLKAYLANSLIASGDEKNLNEAEKLFSETIKLDTGADIRLVLKLGAYTYFMDKYAKDPDKANQCEQMCLKGLDEYPDYIDFKYYLAYALNNKGEFNKAWQLLKTCEIELATKANLADSALVSADPSLVYSQMVISAQGLGDTDNVIKYVTLILKADKLRHSALRPYIATLVRHGKNTDDIIALLKTIYDFSDNCDLDIMIKTAKECGAIDLERKIIAIAGEGML